MLEYKLDFLKTFLRVNPVLFIYAWHKAKVASRTTYITVVKTTVRTNVFFCLVSSMYIAVFFSLSTQYGWIM